MKAKPEWYETFFSGLYANVLAGRLRHPKNLEEARTIKKLLKLRRGHRALDCPCGQGRLTIPLAQMGLKMTGADLTPSYVRRARRYAKAEGLDVPFIRCDMRDLPFNGEFDAVINWFTSFGYFDTAGNLATAKAAFAALKPGGKFLIEILSKSWLLARFTPTGEDDAGGVHIVRRSRWDARGSRCVNTWTMSKGKRRETRRFSHCLYAAAEMRSLLRAAGFRDIQFFGWPPLGRFTRHSHRMIAIAQRPG
jgi:SAM-dependent methyltransferase